VDGLDDGRAAPRYATGGRAVIRLHEAAQPCWIVEKEELIKRLAPVRPRCRCSP